MGLPTVVFIVTPVALAAALAMLFVLALARSAASADRHSEPLLAELLAERLPALGAQAGLEIEARRIQTRARPQTPPPPETSPPVESPPPWARAGVGSLSRRQTWRQPSSA